MEKITAMSYGHEHWNETITFAKLCSWKAGVFLAQKMQENNFDPNERVIIAVIDDAIAGFCTYANKDEIPDKLNFTPFVGFIFVDEKYRGKRLSERLINMACKLGKEQGYKKIYIMSGEIGLYEKYGFTKIGDYKTIYGTIDQLFSRQL